MHITHQLIRLRKTNPLIYDTKISLRNEEVMVIQNLRKDSKEPVQKKKADGFVENLSPIKAIESAAHRRRTEPRWWQSTVNTRLGRWEERHATIHGRYLTTTRWRMWRLEVAHSSSQRCHSSMLNAPVAPLLLPMDMLIHFRSGIRLLYHRYLHISRWSIGFTTYFPAMSSGGIFFRSITFSATSDGLTRGPYVSRASSGCLSLGSLST